MRRLDARRVRGGAADRTAGPTGCSVRRRAPNDVREVDPAAWWGAAAEVRGRAERARWTACVLSAFSGFELVAGWRR
eukprot:COSAG02_NODE_4647_length_5135_cov_13.557188_1_plen_77_part_00